MTTENGSNIVVKIHQSGMLLEIMQPNNSKLSCQNSYAPQYATMKTIHRDRYGGEGGGDSGIFTIEPVYISFLGVHVCFNHSNKIYQADGWSLRTKTRGRFAVL